MKEDMNGYLHFMRLWDVYHPLLTKTQQEICDLYFNCDLSLAEIAEERGCSRQSVSDCLGKCRSQLEAYEGKLHFVRSYAEGALAISLLKDDLAQCIQSLPLEAAQRVSSILQKDYTEQIDLALKEHTDTLL